MVTALSLERLHAYCKKHNIAVPPGARRDQCEAAIARAMLHTGMAEADPAIGCFGHWSEHDKNCDFCDYEATCYRASMGTEKKVYDKFITSIENPQVRFIPMRKKERALKAEKTRAKNLKGKKT